MAYGMQGHLGIGEETTWGTAVAAADYFQALSESLVYNIDRFETVNITGNLYEPDDAAGVNRFAGDVVLAAHPISIGYFLKGVFGQNTVTSLDATLMQNVFTFVSADVSSLHPVTPYTFEVYRPGESGQSSAFQFAGVQISDLALNVAPNQDLRATANMVGKSIAGITKTSPSFPGSPVEAFHFDTCSVQLPGGTAIDRVEALTFNFQNQLEGIPTLNASNNVSRIKRTGHQLVRVTGTIGFVDFTEYNAFANQTEQRLVAHWTKANSFALTVDIPRMVFTSYPVAMPGRERITVEFEAMGRYHTGSGNAAKAILTTIQSF